MKKIDFKKVLKEEYSQRKNKISVLNVSKKKYLMISGVGNPNISKDYKEAIETLYSIAYSIKFKIKKGNLQKDYGVMPLESLWWADDMEAFIKNNKDEWKWTVSIMQPDFVTKIIFEEVLVELYKKKKLSNLSKVSFDSYNDGLCAQILHVGSYSEEKSTIEKLHNFIIDNGYALRGKHREIYLNDCRRCSVDNLKTIIRQPIIKL